MLYIASPVPDPLAQEMEDVFGRIRSAERPSSHSREGAEVVMRLTEAALDYYFLRSVDLLGLGSMARQATRLGLKTSMSGISVFVMQLSKKMSDEQVLKLTDMIEDLLLEVPDEEASSEEA